MSTNADDSINNNHLNGDEEVEDAEDDEAVDAPEAGAAAGTAAGLYFDCNCKSQTMLMVIDRCGT